MAPKKNKATFVIQVQFNQNATWQGTLRWVDKQKQQNFRSMLELVRLLDEALQSETEIQTAKWEEE